MKVKGLAYVVAESPSPTGWIDYGEAIIGLAAERLPGGGLALKADERRGRIFVDRGPVDRYAASGWEMPDETSYDRMLERVAASGTPVQRASADDAAARGFIAMARFSDPAGNRHELCWGYRSDFVRFVSPIGIPSFVMAGQGMGHTVLPAPNFEATRAFFTDVMGMGMADLMIHRPQGDAGPAMRIHFMHADNPRHHSLALFEGEVPSGCVHMMLEYPDMDEVGRAMDRVAAAGVKLMASLGRHINDGVISFYSMTPGGFAIELGFGGRQMDWDNHIAFESTAASLWGHDFSIGFDVQDNRRAA